MANAVIALMKGHPAVQSHVRQVGRRQLRICATVEGELWFGVARTARVAENTDRLLKLLDWLPCLPFSGDATRRFGEIRAHLNRQGTPIGPYWNTLFGISAYSGGVEIGETAGWIEVMRTTLTGCAGKG
jgi:predicted nucleic acid-binding protein